MFPVGLQVVSVNFHPFYRNPTEVVRKEDFQTNYTSITMQDDILAQKTENLNKVIIIDAIILKSHLPS